MANFSMIINNFLLLSRRSYKVAAENVRVQGGGGGGGAAGVIRKVADLKVEGSATSLKKEEFWMRDPKTGNWIPESHFNEIDVAELREKLLSKKKAT
ncbi:hypothetical protein JRO89_XS09G0240400 [Xanthoceras sorbifolium]|uniref:Late embryogenesis abundant protein n=1 Tax=Xanthoceras sorbifolium TaxID=99658 RepID=A0ABQ8HMW1_9ROSI|nr:hypothetical protein JRO89_XS09G0240400 [Xanthoceras sorbifolium]